MRQFKGERRRTPSAIRLRVTLSVLGAVVCTTLAALAVPRLAQAAPSGGSPPCDSSFDPYSYTQAAVEACGYKTFPLEASSDLPGGGNSYQYTVEGMQVRYYVPPEGFNALTASNSQLDEYGFPERPSSTDTTAYEDWSEKVSSWSGTPAAPSFLAETQSQSMTSSSSNWSGYMIEEGAGAFSHAEAWYDEPSIYASVCLATDESTWAGIGGSTPGSDLAQDGTAWGFRVPAITKLGGRYFRRTWCRSILVPPKGPDSMLPRDGYPVASSSGSRI